MKDPDSFSRNRIGVCFQFMTEVSVKGWKELAPKLFAGVIALTIIALVGHKNSFPGGDPENPPPAGAIRQSMR